MGGLQPVLLLLLRLYLEQQKLMVGYYCSISYNQFLVATSHLVYRLAKQENYKGNACDL